MRGLRSWLAAGSALFSVLGLAGQVHAGSGPEAGYNWAEAHDIDDPHDCGGKSTSFIEGCETYAEEQQAESHSDDEDSGSEDEEDE